MHSFLLIGQSNMAGRGSVNEVPPIDHMRMKRLVNGRWQKLWEPLHSDRVFAGIGLAPSFGLAWLKDHEGEEIGFIPCAEGGSALDEWLPGEALFDHAVLQAKLAMRTSTIDGILWHQGESDTDDDLYPLYEEKFEKIVTALREETGLKDVPLIIGGLGYYLKDCHKWESLRNWKKVDDALIRFSENHENTVYATAEGLTSNPDILHFNAMSQRKFGLRYYEAFKTGKAVMAPVSGEAEYEAEALKFQASTPEEKKEALRQAMMSGLMNNQEFEHRMALL